MAISDRDRVLRRAGGRRKWHKQQREQQRAVLTAMLKLTGGDPLPILSPHESRWLAKAFGISKRSMCKLKKLLKRDMFGD